MLLCGHAWAYVIINAENFPDATFRAYVQENFDDGDGILIDDEIAYVYDISVSGLGISSLKGIEHFTELETLECENNLLAELNVPDSLTDSSVFGSQTVTGHVLTVSTEASYPYQFDLSDIRTSSDNISHVQNIRAFDNYDDEDSEEVSLNTYVGGGYKVCG